METDLQNRQLNDKYILRMPDGWRNAIKIRAALNRRSMNQEILTALESVVSAATGEGLANTAPAAASNNNAALASGASVTNG